MKFTVQTVCGVHVLFTRSKQWLWGEGICMYAGQAIIRCVCDAISPISIITPSVRAYGDNRNTTAEINLLLASSQSCDVLHSASMRRIDWRLVTRHFVKHTSPRVEHDAYLAIAVVYIFITWQHYFFVSTRQSCFIINRSCIMTSAHSEDRHCSRDTGKHRHIGIERAMHSTPPNELQHFDVRLDYGQAMPSHTHAHTHSHRFISWPCGFIPRCTYSRFEAQCH